MENWSNHKLEAPDVTIDDGGVDRSADQLRSKLYHLVRVVKIQKIDQNHKLEFPDATIENGGVDR